MSKPLVSIVMGSDSDLEIMREAGKALEGFGIPYEIDVTSAHRSPDRTLNTRAVPGRGISVIIAGAGGAAILPE
jgi:phosphoribosylaminoimidazole carboxylase PurE protein